MNSSTRIPVHTRDSAPTTCQEAEPFALRVTDDSMAPEFPAGCVVIVDPGALPAHGCFVVARTAHGAVLRRLACAAERWTLEALAPGHPPLAYEAAAVLGCVIQRAGRRRREHKHYG